MSSRLPGVARLLAIALVAGLLVAAADGGVLLATARDAFLSTAEARMALLASACACVALAAVLVLFAAVGLRLARDDDSATARRRATWATFVSATALADVGFWLLTEGRRAHAMRFRALLVALAAFVLGGMVALAVRGALSVRESGPESARRALALVTGSLAIASVGVSALVLPRTYPVFHVGLGLGALGLAMLFADAVLPRALDARRPRSVVLGLGALAFVAMLAAWPALMSLRRTPNARYVAEESAPVVGRVVRVVRLLTPVPLPRPPSVSVHPRALPDAGVAPAEGLALRSQDVLLVTIDALRFDRLRALGGHGLTPAIDALARDGVLFRHAYTATPHTSYALSSILTGKLIRPVMELPSQPTDHVTLPELLRRYGIRTAAFYPPAIFFVDEARFTAFHARGFGFEYRKEMYAPAAARVAQLSEYLTAVGTSHPVFVWVHLFEPHEPYDPLPEYRTGDTAEERYDGEVRASDAAFGELVRVFREARPGGTVIVTADHGEEFGDHGGEYHGTTLYEEQARVPLVWSSPGAAPQHVVDAPVSTIDLAPTLLAALGIPKDARMRGEDLGPILRDGDAPGPAYAYASLGETWMVTDGTYKEICVEDEPECRLFDLAHDAHERDNIASSAPARAAELRRALSAMIGSIPRVEALAMANGVGWPEALARAELGDPTAGPDVVPLLASDRADVRAAAARSLAKLGYAPAAATLARLRAEDGDEVVRAEAAIAGLLLGDAEAREVVDALARTPADGGPGALDRTRRAALALSRSGDATGAAVLIALALDDEAPETSRVDAMRALGELHDRDAVPALVSQLPDVRLRIPAARALGAIGDRRAAPALLAALAQERYVPARGEEARALATMGERRAVASIRRFLGVEIPVPDGVLALRRLGDLARPSGRGVDLVTAAAARRGTWTCDATACLPGQDAVLALPQSGLPRGAARVVVRTTATGVARLSIAGVARPVVPGESETTFALADAAVLRSADVHAGGDVRVIALAVVSPQDELPPPPPEPWEDAGTSVPLPDAGTSGPRPDAGVAPP